MTSYQAPVNDITFTLQEIAGLGAIARLPGYEEATPDTVAAILEAGAKFAADILAPLNASGDREGCRLDNGAVSTPKGFREAYRQFADGGWTSLPFDPAFGGQGLPWALVSALYEMWNAANLSFAACPVLSQGAIDAIATHGSDAQKAKYLPHLVSGHWCGTMNLTEPAAGSDLGAIKTRAEPTGGHYRIKGQKIFITHGEHDFTENIVHLVLARLPDAPKGSKGISLFIAPKFLVNEDGSLGKRNDVRCLSIEHKLGIHASPTCVMAFGEGEGGAIAELVGEANRGLEYMFTMMNSARLGVGVQGLGLSERAFQMARAYARARVQGAVIGAASGQILPILHHPDIRRNLMTMRALSEGQRALCYFAAGTLDRARHSPDAAERRQQQSLVDLLIPIVKGWSTEQGMRAASIGVQIHGGAGYIEETGAAQLYRDARIPPIYEGTNGIQAIDLVGRKLLKDEGIAMRALITQMTEGLSAFGVAGDDLPALRERLLAAIQRLGSGTDFMLLEGKRDLKRALAVATPYLMLAGTVLAGWLLARAGLAASHRLAAGTDDTAFLKAKIATARFFADNILTESMSLAAAINGGSESTLRLDPEAI